MSTAVQLVVGVNKDDCVVLVDAILVDPVKVQDAQVIAPLAHPTPLRSASIAGTGSARFGNRSEPELK
jgi:hypothetical protein